MRHPFILVIPFLIGTLACSFSGIFGSPQSDVNPEHKIAYAADKGLSRDIYLMYPDGSNKINLTERPGYRGYGYPAWSPDGTKIAFIGSDFDNEDDIFIMDADGSNIVRLTDDPGRDYDFAWSPDGNQIAFVSTRANDHGDIFVINIDGSGLRQLTHSDKHSKNPAWSPDGSRILFDHDFEVAVIDRSGSNMRILTQIDDGWSESPSWSPDGSRIAFTVGVEMNDERKWAQLFVALADGSGMLQLTNSKNEHARPVWSPSGDQIALRISDGSTGKFYPWVINSDGSALHQISDSWAHKEKLRWSPDGKVIIHYGADEDPDWDIYITSADGSEETQLTDTDRFEGEPDWRN